MPILRHILAIFTAFIALALAMPVIVLGIPFVVVSCFVRKLTTYLEPPSLEWPDIFEFDSFTGWKVKANLDCYCLEKRSDIFHVKTDRDGWPGTTRIDESEVIVFGDSHAFGYGIDQAKSFSQINPNLRIKAIGVPGYNMVQELLLMERLAPQLGQKMIVWFNYMGNDLYDNLSPEMNGYRAPFVRKNEGNGEWEIVTSHLASTPWTCSAGVKTLVRTKYPLKQVLHSDSLLARRAYSACESLIQRGAKLCNLVGSRLIVMSIPDTFALVPQQVAKAQTDYPFLKGLDADYPDHELGAICHKAGVQFVALKHHLDRNDYQARDDHWTEQGHRRVANVLRDLYCDRLAGTSWGRETVGREARAISQDRFVSLYRLHMRSEKKNSL